jgi:hypothetical protein
MTQPTPAPTGISNILRGSRRLHIIQQDGNTRFELPIKPSPIVDPILGITCLLLAYTWYLTLHHWDVITGRTNWILLMQMVHIGFYGVILLCIWRWTYLYQCREAFVLTSKGISRYLTYMGVLHGQQHLSLNQITEIRLRQHPYPGLAPGIHLIGHPAPLVIGNSLTAQDLDNLYPQVISILHELQQASGLKLAVVTPARPHKK